MREADVGDAIVLRMRSDSMSEVSPLGSIITAADAGQDIANCSAQGISQKISGGTMDKKGEKQLQVSSIQELLAQWLCKRGGHDHYSGSL